MTTRPGFTLLAITPPTGAVSLEMLEIWLRAGAQTSDIAVLLREPGRRLLDLLAPDSRLAALRLACDRRGIRVLASCNRRDLLHAVEAIDQVGLSGVQLRGDPSLDTLRRARAGLDDALVGRSVHGDPQAGHMFVDYSCLSPVFTPRTDPGDKRPVGCDTLRKWASEPDARVFALGGVTGAKARACFEAGARGLAGISSFFGDPDTVTEDVGRLVAALAARNDPDRVSPPPPRPRT